MKVDDLSYTDLVAWVKLNPDAAASKLIVLDLRAQNAETRIAAALYESTDPVDRAIIEGSWPSFFVNDN